MTAGAKSPAAVTAPLAGDPSMAQLVALLTSSVETQRTSNENISAQIGRQGGQIEAARAQLEGVQASVDKALPLIDTQGKAMEKLNRIVLGDGDDKGLMQRTGRLEQAVERIEASQTLVHDALLKSVDGQPSVVQQTRATASLTAGHEQQIKEWLVTWPDFQGILRFWKPNPEAGYPGGQMLLNKLFSRLGFLQWLMGLGGLAVAALAAVNVFYDAKDHIAAQYAPQAGYYSYQQQFQPAYGPQGVPPAAYAPAPAQAYQQPVYAAPGAVTVQMPVQAPQQPMQPQYAPQPAYQPQQAPQAYPAPSYGQGGAVSVQVPPAPRGGGG